MSDSVQPHRWQPTRLHCPWDSPGKNTGVDCHFLLQCMKVKGESEVTQSCPTLSNPMDCSLPSSSVHRIFQARARMLLFQPTGRRKKSCLNLKKMRRLKGWLLLIASIQQCKPNMVWQQEEFQICSNIHVDLFQKFQEEGLSLKEMRGIIVALGH